MALVKATLSAAIKAINAEMASGSGLTSDQYADKLATAIDDYIKTALVKITANQAMVVAVPPVQTLTTLANGGGPVLGSIATPAAGFEWTGSLT